MRVTTNLIKEIALFFKYNPQLTIQWHSTYIIPGTFHATCQLIELDLIQLVYLESLQKKTIAFQFILYYPDGTRRCVSRKYTRIKT